MLGIFRNVVATALALLSLVGAAMAQTAPATPDVRNVKTFHDVGKLKGLTFTTDEDARRLVDDLLGYLGLHADYQIYVTDNAATTANAAAAYDTVNKSREVFFNRAFMQKYQQSSHSDVGLQFIAAHELSHLIALHAQRHIDPIQQEIEADYYAGFVLGAKLGDCDRVVAAITAFPDQAARERTATHPALAQRRVAVGKGCSDATGELPPELSNVAIPTANVPSILTQFTTKFNRDIFGKDVALIAGKPGIPGSTLESCAHVCYGLPSCKGFTFNRWKNFCYLKGELGDETFLHPAGIIGVKKPQTIPGASTLVEPTTEYLFNAVFADAPLRETTAVDYRTCSKSCLGDIHCVAFSYLRAANKCKMFNRVEGHYRDDAFDSGYKWQQPNTTWSSVVTGNR
jgi:PAN domain